MPKDTTKYHSLSDQKRRSVVHRRNALPQNLLRLSEYRDLLLPNLLTDQEHDNQDAKALKHFEKLDRSIDSPRLIAHMVLIMVKVALQGKGNKGCISDWVACGRPYKELIKLLESEEGDGPRYYTLFNYCFHSGKLRHLRNLAILRTDGQASPTFTFKARDGYLVRVSCTESHMRKRLEVELLMDFPVPLEYKDLLIADLPRVKNVLSPDEHKAQDEECMEQIRRTKDRSSIPAYYVLTLLILAAFGQERNKARMAEWPLDNMSSGVVDDLVASPKGDGRKYFWLIRHCVIDGSFQPLRNLSVLRNDGEAWVGTTMVAIDGMLHRKLANKHAIRRRQDRASIYGIDYLEHLELPSVPLLDSREPCRKGSPCNAPTMSASITV